MIEPMIEPALTAMQDTNPSVIPQSVADRWAELHQYADQELHRLEAEAAVHWAIRFLRTYRVLIIIVFVFLVGFAIGVFAR